MVAYATLGRLLGGLLSLAMPVLAVWQVITPPLAFVSCLYMGGMGALVALIELPMLCSCSRWCKLISAYTRVIAGFWVTRAVIYILIAAGGFAIYQLEIPAPAIVGQPALPPDSQRNPYALGTCVGLVLTAAFYLVAMFKREPNPWQPAAAAAAPPPPAAAAGGLFGMFAGGAASAAAANPAAAASFAKAAAPSLAQQMFGGFGGGAPAAKEVTAKSFYADDEESGAAAYTPPTAPLSPAKNGAPSWTSGFGGGGGGGGGKAKAGAAAAPKAAAAAPAAAPPKQSYGFVGEDDVAEANPFQS